MTQQNKLCAAQHAGGFVLMFRGVASGGNEFLGALRKLYCLVEQKDKPIIEKVGKDKVLLGIIEDLRS